MLTFWSSSAQTVLPRDLWLRDLREHLFKLQWLSILFYHNNNGCDIGDV